MVLSQRNSRFHWRIQAVTRTLWHALEARTESYKRGRRFFNEETGSMDQTGKVEAEGVVGSDLVRPEGKNSRRGEYRAHALWHFDSGQAIFPDQLLQGLEGKRVRISVEVIEEEPPIPEQFRDGSRRLAVIPPEQEQLSSFGGLVEGGYPILFASSFTEAFARRFEESTRESFEKDRKAQADSWHDARERRVG